MCRQMIDRRLNRNYRASGRRLVLFNQELKRSLDMFKRAAGIYYLRHGLGRATLSPAASLLIQACTSSAR
jgi:hypothetical protein